MPYAIDIGIEGKKLETSQREAILANGKNVLVNAGAGSGKTFTILAKILHILDQKLAEPEEIIVVAYNNKVANDLRDRFGKLTEEFPDLAEKIKRVSISKDKICPDCNEKINQTLHWCEKLNKFVDRKIHTFHSYCYDLIKKNENKQLAKFLKGNEDKLKELKSSKFLIEIIEEISSKDQYFLKKVNTFFLSEIYHYKNIFKNIHSMDEYERHIRPRHVELKEYQEMRDRERKEELEKLRKDEIKVVFKSAPRKDPNRGMRFVSCSDPINKGKLGSSRSFLNKKDRTYY